MSCPDEQCPRCSVPLVQASLSGERVLYCQRCHGLLIDMGVFQAVVEDMRSHHSSSEYAGVQPDWDALNRHTKCPKCGQEMDTHPYGGPGNVIIDTCVSIVRSIGWITGNCSTLSALPTSITSSRLTRTSG